MKANDENVAAASSDTVPANTVKILRVVDNPTRSDSIMLVDEESIGFDPYDTASLFVQSTSQKSADPS